VCTPFFPTGLTFCVFGNQPFLWFPWGGGSHTTPQKTPPPFCPFNPVLGGCSKTWFPFHHNNPFGVSPKFPTPCFRVLLFRLKQPPGGGATKTKKKKKKPTLVTVCFLIFLSTLGCGGGGGNRPPPPPNNFFLQGVGEIKMYVCWFLGEKPNGVKLFVVHLRSHQKPFGPTGFGGFETIPNNSLGVQNLLFFLQHHFVFGLATEISTQKLGGVGLFGVPIPSFWFSPKKKPVGGGQVGGSGGLQQQQLLFCWDRGGVKTQKSLGRFLLGGGAPTGGSSPPFGSGGLKTQKKKTKNFWGGGGTPPG